MSSLSVIILAAGQGRRMVSDIPKVLHRIGGKSLLGHVLDTAKQLDAAQRIVVYGHGGEQVRIAFADDENIIWAEQKEQLGTGHAVKQTFSELQEGGIALVLYGDVPLIKSETLQPLLASAKQDQLALLTVEFSDPHGYGRILRDDANGNVQKIVEQKDTTPEQESIREVNSGILAAPTKRLRRWIEALKNNNAQNEYYLTDIVEIAVKERIIVDGIRTADSVEVLGVNDRKQLAELERYYQRWQVDKLMLNGATALDPDRLDVRGKVTTGKDVIIDINVIFEGNVQLGDRVQIGPTCVLKDCRIGDDTEVLANSVLEDVVVGKNVSIGPFARLRPGTRLGDKSKIGNFVETKNAVIGENSKASHLTYLGDAEIGNNVNIGAGTITCNYDGANKHKTVIEDDVFIGSNNSLVAPIRIGHKASTGAGSTLSKNVVQGSLALTRGELRQIERWKRTTKKL